MTDPNEWNDEVAGTREDEPVGTEGRQGRQVHADLHPTIRRCCSRSTT